MIHPLHAPPRSVLTLGLLILSAATVQAQNPLKLPFETLDGSLSGGQLGKALAAAGDVDGDGVGDLVVGAPGEGTARVLSGVDLRRVLHTFHHPGIGSLGAFGRAVAGVGDVNGDGHADVAVASSSFTKVFSGADGAEWLHVPTQAVSNLITGVGLGGGADVNGDGYDDLVLGYPVAGNSLAQGRVQVRSGLDGTLLHSIDASGTSALGPVWLGWSVALIEDVDGDGLAEIAAGAPGDNAAGPGNGSLRVFSGADGSELHAVLANSTVGHLGISLAATGDLDGDGAADLLVGSPYEWIGYDRKGAVRAVSGRTGQVLYTVQGSVFDGEFGRSVAGGGDVDGDGIDDVLVGALDLARLASGADGSLLVKYNKQADDFGAAVALAVDLNGDGRIDPAVGVPGADLGTRGGDEGQVRFFLGACDLVETYCTAGTSAAGCAGALSGAGTPSASQPAGFVVTATGLAGSTRGLVLSGIGGRDAHPFGGGGSLLCLHGRAQHSAPAPTGGTPGACDGSLALDLAQLGGGGAPVGFRAGARVQLQAAFRDPVSGRPVLTNALELTVCP